MVAFYKHDIAAWMDGTESLSANAYRAYHVVCQLIYLHEGPIALNERGIAGRCNMSSRSFAKAMDELKQAGKIVVENGKISNSRATKELGFIETNRENAKTGGIISGKVRNASTKPLKTNKPDEAPLQEDRSLIEKTREEETLSRRVAKSTPPNDRFEEFWREYPRREGENPKAPARKVFEALVKSGTDPSAIVSGIRCAKTAHRDKIGTPYIPQAVKWLRDRRFEDYHGPPKASGGSPEAIPDEHWDRAVAAFKRRVPWPQTFGPAPGFSGCHCPAAILAKHGYTQTNFEEVA